MSLSLLEFCARNKVKIAELARLGDLDKGTLYKIARGERGFEPKTAAKIERVTGGVVTPNDLTKVRMEWLRKNPESQKKSAERQREKADA